MQTLSERDERRRAEHDEARRRDLAGARAFVWRVLEKGIPLRGPERFSRSTLEQRTEMRNHMRHAVSRGQMPLMGVACDHCGTELVNREPGTITASCPPKYHVGCIGCGWLGWMNQ